MLLKQLMILAEASTARRAWEGKLKNIDKLLWWMYDRNILTKTEQAEKDRVFRQYYRYYNDGDMPGFLKTKGFSKFTPEEKTEKALEEYLEAFIKKILSKYLPKIDRASFRFDKILDELDTVIDVSERYDPHALLTYWIKKVKIEQGSELSNLLNELEKDYNAFDKALKKSHPDLSNYIMTYRREKMQATGEWTDDLEKSWSNITATMDKITKHLKDLKSSVEKLKKEKIESK